MRRFQANPHPLLIASLLFLSFSVIADVSADNNSLRTLHYSTATFPAKNQYEGYTQQAGGYVFVNDKDRLLDNLKSMYEKGLVLEGKSRGLLVIPGDEAELVEQLENAENDKTSFSAGGHFALLTESNDWIVVGGSVFDASGRFNYDDNDANRLRFATVLGLFGLGDLESTVNVSGVWKNYLGLNYRYQLDSLPDTRIGLTTKLQSISLIERAIFIDEYDEDKLFDQSRDVGSKVQLNADLGIQHQFDSWVIGVNAADIYQQKFKGPNGTTYQQRSHLSGSISYASNWSTVLINADITPQQGFGELSSHKDYHIRFLLPVSTKLGLMLGYQWIDSNDQSDLPHLGFRYAVGDLLRIEAGFSFAGPREFGGSGSLQLPL
ncbi:conjugal transfer protein TraF [Zhongshania sp. BJYM1]|uniref:conjugal transfer protein TraF n=1 Tax=Zhongshania aquatica TaxID=2965069 RepID=UPI0022B54121|nr:conjugal transfer protein TraF [Marortus sp. BJYM1]